MDSSESSEKKLSLAREYSFNDVLRITSISKARLRKWTADCFRWKTGLNSRKTSALRKSGTVRFCCVSSAAASRIAPVYTSQGLSNSARAGHVPGTSTPKGWRIFIPAVKEKPPNTNPTRVKIIDMKTGKLVHWFELPKSGVDEVVHHLRIFLFRTFPIVDQMVKKSRGYGRPFIEAVGRIHRID